MKYFFEPYFFWNTGIWIIVAIVLFFALMIAPSLSSEGRAYKREQKAKKLAEQKKRIAQLRNDSK